MSFEGLALPHLDAVYRVARRLTRSDHDAEDLVQETYLKAHRAFAGFEIRDFGIKPWLFKILHNTFLNNRAKDARAPRSADPLAFDQSAAADSPGSDSPPPLDYDALDQEVKAAIDDLSPEFRGVLLLWATMELSYQEIAGTLEIPLGTVMSRLHRARQQLAQRLRDYARENRMLPTKETV